MTQPTIFGARNNTLLAGGEAGPKIWVTIRKLIEKISQ